MSQSQLANHTWSLLKNSEVPDVDGLTESAHQSFKTLHHWYSTERKQHTSIVLKTSDEIVQGSERYFDAISASVEMAKSGSNFANQAGALSQRLSEGQPMSPRDFRACVTSMLTIATKANNQARAVEDKFGQVRVGLIKVSGNVQSHLAAVAEGRNNRVGGPSVSRIAARGEVVIAPESSESSEASLTRAQEDLNGLLISVSHFCNWWANMVTQLGVIEAIIPDTATEGFDTFLGTNVQDRWLDIEQKNNLYAQRIKLIEQIHSDLVQAQRRNRSKFTAFGLIRKRRSRTVSRTSDSSDTGCIIC